MPCFFAASASGTSFLIADAGICTALVEILAILILSLFRGTKIIIFSTILFNFATYFIKSENLWQHSDKEL